MPGTTDPKKKLNKSATRAAIITDSLIKLVLLDLEPAVFSLFDRLATPFSSNSRRSLVIVSAVLSAGVAHCDIISDRSSIHPPIHVLIKLAIY